MSDLVTINRADVDRLIGGLRSSATQDAMTHALAEGAVLLQGRAKTTLISRVKGATSDAVKMRHGKMQSYGAPVNGILYHVMPGEANVNIMAEYRLKWFQRGTQLRYTKKRPKPGIYRGVMTPTYFFTDAIRSSLSDLRRVITESLDKYFKTLAK